ncbi:MAG: hypothetical protein QI199_04750, partial [Candidatus Korarchaeota archaeon]|nr:hypothetical protein [Candidatus Korarchaeota archaeon]
MGAVAGQARIGAVIIVLVLAAAAIYLAAGLGGSREEALQAYGACFECGGTLTCIIDVVNEEDSILTLSAISLSMDNGTLKAVPTYNYTSIPGRSHSRVVLAIGGGGGRLVLSGPRYRVETGIRLVGRWRLPEASPRSVFNETWVSPEGEEEGFYPVMLQHRGLVTGPGEAAYLVLRASAINANITLLHVKLYAFHDELVYEDVRAGPAAQHRILVPLYYAGHEAISGATSLLVSYRLSGSSDSMLVIETEAWRTIPVHVRLEALAGQGIDTYLPLIPGDEAGACGERGC